MELPEPARTAWRRCADAINEHLCKHLDGFPGWKVHGGTILAARWAHRESTDIDLLIPAKSGVEYIKSTNNPGAAVELATEMARLGATGINEKRRSQIIIELKESRIDIFESDPPMRYGFAAERVGHRTERVMSNAQIIAGKMSRGGGNPVRDLFDIAVAAEVDGRSLETAVNGWSEETMKTVADRWSESAGQYRRDAEQNLKGVPREWERIKADPAAAAIAATADRMYRKAELHVSKDAAAWRTTCRDGREREAGFELTEASKLDRWLHETGIERYIEGTGDPAVLKAAREARERVEDDAPQRPSAGRDGRGPTGRGRNC